MESNDADLSGINPRTLVDEYDAEYEIEEAQLRIVAPEATRLEVVNARILDPEQVLLDIHVEVDGDIEFRLRRTSWERSSFEGDLLGEEDPPRSMTGTKTRPFGLKLEATYRPTSATITEMRLVAASTLTDPDEERLQRFRAYSAGEPKRREWSRRAQAAATRWASDQGFHRVAGESVHRLDVRGDRGAMLFEFVADPGMITWLRAAAHGLGLLRGMIDPGTRAAIVVPSRLEPQLAERLANSLQPPIELYVLVEDELVRL